MVKSNDSYYDNRRKEEEHFGKSTIVTRCRRYIQHEGVQLKYTSFFDNKVLSFI